MQKALAPVNSLQNDCFANDAVEEAEETDAVVSVHWRTTALEQTLEEVDQFIYLCPTQTKDETSVK